ncbi:MAG: hypothetical protein NTW87_30725, partial [Planctomycetota bacterium]|nr:hypothetical protein [Planctomycetota bacterium]
DLAGLLGDSTSPAGARIRGQVRYDVSARSGPPPEGASLGPIAFSGQFILDDFHWPLTPTRALDATERVIDLRGKATPGADPEALAVVDKLFVRVDSVGTLRGSGKLPLTPGPFVSLSKVHGTVDAEGLNQILTPRLWGDSVTIKGSLQVSELSAALPLAADAPPFSLSAQLVTSGARIAIRDVGELPSCDANGTLAWPALRNVVATVGDVGKIIFSLNDVGLAASDSWLALGRGAVVHHVKVDIGRFLESEFGRRLVAGTFEQDKLPPPVTDLPYILKGHLSGTGVKLTLDESAGKPTGVTLENLRLLDASIAKWPFPFNVPARKLSGPVRISALLAGGAVQEVTAQASLSSGGANEAASASVELEETCLPQAPPGKRLGPIHVERLVLPLEDLDQIFGLRDLAGLSGTGTIEAGDAVYDPGTGSMTGTVELRNVKLTVALPAGLQAAMPPLLKMADYAVTGAVLEKYPIKTVTFSNVSARLQAEVKEGRMTLSGDIEPLDIRPDLPALGDTKLATLPATKLAVQLDVAPKSGGRTCTVGLEWGNGTKLNVTLKREPPPAAEAEKGAPGGGWRATGALTAAALGPTAATFDVPFDLAQQTVGPSTFTLPDVDLARLRKMLDGTGVQETKGHLKDLELKLKAFSLNSVSAAKLANGDVSGVLAGVHVSSGLADVDRLNGDFRVVVSSSGETAYVNSTIRLSSYEALLGNGEFHIPPPAQGQGGWLRLVAKCTRRESGADVQLDSCQVNLGGEVKLDTAGALAFTKTGLSKINLEVLKLSIPDMAQAWKTFGPPNLKNRDPWFGDIGLAGTGRFDGKLLWEAGGKLALDGKCLFDDSTLSLGKPTVFKLEKMSGELPLVVRAGGGAAAGDKGPVPAELRGQIKLGPLQWVQNPANKEWVQKKDLKE